MGKPQIFLATKFHLITMSAATIIMGIVLLNAIILLRSGYPYEPEDYQLGVRLAEVYPQGTPVTYSVIRTPSRDSKVASFEEPSPVSIYQFDDCYEKPMVTAVVGDMVYMGVPILFETQIEGALYTYRVEFWKPWSPVSKDI